jgi:type I restriction enzyme S subunit
MSNWRNVEIGKVIDFNPSESIKKGTIAKKIPMDKLRVFEKKIKGFEFSEYSAGPKFRNGDTLVAKITPCLENGKTAQVDLLEENEVAFGSSEFIVLRENENTINDYIFYLAKSPAFRKRAISCMEGTSGRKRVNEGALKLQVLPIPDIITQQKIARVLSNLDAKIELNNHINTELEAMAKTLYDYWFVQFDFPDTNGKPYKSTGGKMARNEELKREIPEGWEVKFLTEEMDLQYGFPFSTDLFNDNLEGVPIIRIRDILNCSISNYSTEEVDEKYKLLKGDILVGMDGNFHINYWNKENCFLNQRCLRIRLNSESISQMQARFSIEPFIKAREKNVSRTTVAHLSAKDVNDLKLLKATSKIQLQANEFFKSTLDKIISNRVENQELASLRDWLLPMLMNGQVSAGEIEEELGMVAESNVEYKKEVIDDTNKIKRKL